MTYIVTTSAQQCSDVCCHCRCSTSLCPLFFCHPGPQKWQVKHHYVTTLYVALRSVHWLLSLREIKFHPPVLRAEIPCILVHILWELSRSVVVIVCSPETAAQSLQDLVPISVHSTWIVPVWDLLIDCVHCYFLFELHTGELIFISAWPVFCTNTLSDAIVMPSAGVMPHLLSIQNINVTTQVCTERQISPEPSGSGSFVSCRTPAWEWVWRWGEGHELLYTGPLGTAAGSWKPKGRIRRGKAVKLHIWSWSLQISKKWTQVVELSRSMNRFWGSTPQIMWSVLGVSH